MTTHLRFSAFVLMLSLLMLSLLWLTSCNEREDPGPLQDYEKEYSMVDFDRLEMGSGFNIKVEESSTYSVRAEGDRRNLKDLDVYKRGNTLIIKYDDNANRKHQTYIIITMPRLKAVNFSGGSVSVIKGFESEDELDFYLSGGSQAQLDAGYRELNVVLSGASNLVLHGLGDKVTGEVSGASTLSAFDFPVREASLDVSGGSHAKVTVSDVLKAVASGASEILYRGNPVTDLSASGASNIQKD